MQTIHINQREIGAAQAPYVVAEVSANHGGQLQTALETIKAAAAAGADAVKIQTYTPDTMTLNSQASDFVVQGGLWQGRKLYELYQDAHTPYEWHEEMFACAQAVGITLFSTPFDETAVELLEGLATPAYKIASFELTDLPLIDCVARSGKPLVMSTGMASYQEVEEAMETAYKAGAKEVLLLHCISSYPALTEQANLVQIRRLQQDFNVPVGLSDHTLDNTAATAAVALGACFVEKHFILDRSLGGPDSAFSIEPDELQQLCNQLRSTWQAMSGEPYQRAPQEQQNKAFRRSIYFVEDIKAGTCLEPYHVRRIRPGFGLSPKYLGKLIGRRLKVDVTAGMATSWQQFED